MDEDEDENTPDINLVGFEHGNFALTRQLGTGKWGTVYLAEHRWIGSKKAVKVLKRFWTRYTGSVRRFMNEATAASACRHEHIIDIHDCGYIQLEDGTERPYIDMEYLEGIDALQACSPTGRMEDIDRAVKLVAVTADALAAAHERGIIHRDMQPQNIFLCRRGARSDYVKVLDFGIARLTGDFAPGPDMRTETGLVIGTPPYMSPEQANGHHPDAKTDVWSLGVVLYRILSGYEPFVEETSFTLLAVKITQETPVDLRERRPEVSEGVVRAVRAAMRKRAEDRPTMVEFRELLVTGDAAPRAVLPELSISAPSSLRHREEPRMASAPTLILASTPSTPRPAPPPPPPRDPAAPTEPAPSSASSPTSSQRPRGGR